METPKVEVKVLSTANGEPKWLVLPVSSALCAEEAITFLARNNVNSKPMTTGLFNLQTSKGRWLTPDQELKDLSEKLFPLTLKIRSGFLLMTRTISA